MRPVITIGYDSDAYEENSFASIRSFFENQKANVKLVHVLRKALDVPSIIEITLHISATYFLKGFFTEAGKDVWKELKKVLLSTKKHDVPELGVRIELQNLLIVTRIRTNEEATIERFMKKFVSSKLDIEEMSKNVPKGLNYIILQYDERQDVFEAKSLQQQEGATLNMRFNFNTKNWEQERE